MTTLAELRIQVANDIRDPLMATFPAPQIDALINAGMNEVSRVYPKETIESVTPLAGTYTYAVEADAVFRVELQRNGVFQRYIPENEDVSSQGGWEFWANMLRLPAPTVDAMIPDTDSLDVWGYAGRAQLLTDDQVADLDTQGEYAVRAYARWMAYQSMLSERALFTQWQAASQNSDISPTQLNQMVALYAGEWDRARNHLRRLRRV